MNDIGKAEKLARKNLTNLCNRIKVEFSTHKIKTFGDYLRKGFGYDDKTIADRLHYRKDELDRTLDFPALKDLLEDLRLGLEADWYLIKNPPELNGHLEVVPSNLITIPPNEIQQASDILDAESDYGLEPSDKEKAFLFWFQKKYSKIILDKIKIHGLRGILLIAQAGTGKTFILGAVLRRLLDSQFHRGKSISPWPYCYITKASVVEQTKRVMEKWFCIDTIRECFVTNYDQMRSSFGKLYVDEETIVVHGEEEIRWKWRPMIHPVVFIIDECQAAKNEQSTQSKIICSIAEIENPHVYCLFSSATPFTRVSEAKYFVVNCRIDRKLF